uniref:Uncharacterized protein n=1 Tax=Strongyloides venezuelensis TaxID=75913 RepID=A0A0K0FSZ0_STRVS
MNRTNKYLIARDIKDVNKIKFPISLMHRGTCLNFSKSHFSPLLTAIRFIADTFYPKRYTKNFYVIPETLKQRNYATELSLSDLKAFNSKICGDECKDHLCGTYSNY